MAEQWCNGSSAGAMAISGALRYAGADLLSTWTRKPTGLGQHLFNPWCSRFLALSSGALGVCIAYTVVGCRQRCRSTSGAIPRLPLVVMFFAFGPTSSRKRWVLSRRSAFAWFCTQNTLAHALPSAPTRRRVIEHQRAPVCGPCLPAFPALHTAIPVMVTNVRHMVHVPTGNRPSGELVQWFA